MLGRLMGKAKELLGEAGGKFRNRTRSAKRLARSIAEGARRREARRPRKPPRKPPRRPTSGSLASPGPAPSRGHKGAPDALRSEAATRRGEGLTDELERFEELIERVADQTERRVLKGESVKAGEKLVSLFEEHTSIIARGKAGKKTEFGRKVWLDEVEGGIVSGYRVLEGNLADEQQLLASLENHLRLFDRPPWLVAADRGVYSPGNEEAARRMGVERVALPKKGAKNEERQRHERQGWFRRARRFRAGIEGRISVMKRRGYPWGGAGTRARKASADG